MKSKGLKIAGKIGEMLVLAALIAFVMGLFIHVYYKQRGHGDVLVVAENFTESTKELKNPNRGFYYMHGFYIIDEEMDFRKEIADRFCMDEDTALTMIQINLAYYREKPISAQGLKNIDFLFKTLQNVDKQLIVRFLYDWDGWADSHEPTDLAIIEKHMEQVGPIAAKYESQILTTQGLFVGNWGEMNGTPFCDEESVKRLAATWFQATEAKLYMAVRMPMFWRMATGIADLNKRKSGKGELSQRLGLYNDGMLGSYSDYGTYGDHTMEKDGAFTYWNREEELAFQEILCKKVPQGGEVIVDNSYNDLENAIVDLSRMHVTYLNRDFDQNVYKKWAASTVHTEDLYDGMDGLSYMERHIGYRLLIQNVSLKYAYLADQAELRVTMQNVGFAPLYKPVEITAALVDEESGEVIRYPIKADLSKLSGGRESDELMTFWTDFPLKGQEEKNYRIYLMIKDTASGKPIALANENEMTEYGYLVGEIHLEKAVLPWER